MNTWKRKALLLVSVPALALPGAIGIYRWLLPARGMVGAVSASVGIELAYLGVSILALTDSELRRHATGVAWAAAIVSVAMNMLLDYGTRVPGGLASTAAFIASFDVLTLAIAALDSIPLAVLSLTSAMLLHRLSVSESVTQNANKTAQDTTQIAYADLVETIAAQGAQINAIENAFVAFEKPETAPRYECPHCGTELHSAGEVGAAKRWGCYHCKETRKNGNEDATETAQHTNGNGHHAQQETIEKMEVLA